MPNVSTKIKSKFHVKIFFPKLLTLNLEISNKKDDFLCNSSCYLVKHLYSVLALISTHVYYIFAWF